MEIVKEQQPKALSNWTGFGETPTSLSDAKKAISAIPKKFKYKAKGVPAPTPLLVGGVATELSQNMGLLSGSEARQLANYIRRYFFRDVVYVSVSTEFRKLHTKTYFSCATREIRFETVSYTNRPSTFT